MKPKVLNISFLLFCFLMQCSSILHSQSYYWSDPVLISDTVSDNRNAIIIDVRYNGSYDYWMFWERSVDSNSTEICVRNFYNPQEIIPVVSAENVHFTNVRVIKTQDNDTLYYLFYESDQNGNKDIFYKIYTINGFTDPILLAGNEYDDTRLRCNTNKEMVWQEGDRIRYARLKKWNSPFIITDFATIDSGNCSEPVISDYYRIAWIKETEDSSFIYYSKPSDAGWTPPILGYGSQKIESLKFAYGRFNNIISWENIVEGEHTIVVWYLGYGEVMMSNFHQQSSFSPSIFPYSIPVDDFHEEGYMTFVYAEDLNDEIYVNPWEFYLSPDIEDYDNISVSPFTEANPAFFEGDYYGSYFDLINLWESNRNGHWQLYYSKTSLLWGGGTPEFDEPFNGKIVVSPNPFFNQCDVNYTLNEDAIISLQLCIPDGRQILLVDQKFLQKGNYCYHLDFDQIFAGNNYSGLFMIRLLAGGSIVSQKLIGLR